MHGPRCKKSFALRRVVTLTEPVHTPSPTPYPHLRPWSLLTRLLLFPETFSPLLPLYWLFIKRVHTICGIPLSLTRTKPHSSLLSHSWLFIMPPVFALVPHPPPRRPPGRRRHRGAHTHVTDHIHMCMCTCHIHMCMCTCHIHIHNDQCHDSDSHLHKAYSTDITIIIAFAFRFTDQPRLRYG